jgi:hypothetical protein
MKRLMPAAITDDILYLHFNAASGCLFAGTVTAHVVSVLLVIAVLDCIRHGLRTPGILAGITRSRANARGLQQAVRCKPRTECGVHCCGKRNAVAHTLLAAGVTSRMPPIRTALAGNMVLAVYLVVADVHGCDCQRR